MHSNKFRQMQMKLSLKTFLLVLVTLTAPVFAGISDGWERLGKESVSSRMDRDEMRIASKGFIKQLAVEVSGSAVYFDSVIVHLGNGDVLDLPIRSIVKDGERSRVMDLPGTARIVKKVIFMHQKVRGDVKAEVILWGRK